MTVGPQQLISLKEAGERFGVSYGTVRNWIEKGYIQAVRYPSGVRKIAEQEVSRVLSTLFSFSAPEEEPAETRTLRGQRQEMEEEDWGPAA